MTRCCACADAAPQLDWPQGPLHLLEITRQPGSFFAGAPTIALSNIVAVVGNHWPRLATWSNWWLYILVFGASACRGSSRRTLGATGYSTGITSGNGNFSDCVASIARDNENVLGPRLWARLFKEHDLDQNPRCCVPSLYGVDSRIRIPTCDCVTQKRCAPIPGATYFQLLWDFLQLDERRVRQPVTGSTASQDPDLAPINIDLHTLLRVGPRGCHIPPGLYGWGVVPRPDNPTPSQRTMMTRGDPDALEAYAACQYRRLTREATDAVTAGGTYPCLTVEHPS